MTDRRPEGENVVWQAHDRAWRHPAQAATGWANAGDIDPRLLRASASNDWWSLLESLGITLLVTREYEHLVIALGVDRAVPHTTFFPLPHPCGLAVDRDRSRALIASTRNPNQIFEFVPADRRLLPIRSRFLPGRLYLHDLAFIGGELYANAVGENAVVGLPEGGWYERRWWPRAIETDAGPAFTPNYLQLNSIAAGADLAGSFFSASTDMPARRLPGHRNFPVDRRGVLFSGVTREPIVRGLTRPHSARLHADRLWVDNSGYGEFGTVCEGRFEVVTRLPGWTRGLAFCGDIAFVGTSRVLPRFRQYAPGLDVERSTCAIYAIDWRSGATLATLRWPHGNQVFGIDWLPSDAVIGFPFSTKSSHRATTELFYTYRSK